MIIVTAKVCQFNKADQKNKNKKDSHFNIFGDHQNTGKKN